MGVKDCQLTAEGYLDESSAAIGAALFDCWKSSTPKNFQAGPEGSASGKTRWTGQFHTASIVFKPSINGTVPFTLSAECTGDTTKDTW